MKGFFNAKAVLNRGYRPMEMKSDMMIGEIQNTSLDEKNKVVKKISFIVRIQTTSAELPGYDLFNKTF